MNVKKLAPHNEIIYQASEFYKLKLAEGRVIPLVAI